jgi:uroporphyrinogen decarboxylase
MSTTITSRERVLTALNHQQPDRTPIFASFVPEISEQLRSAFGIREADLDVALGNDMVKTCVGLELSFYGGARPEYACPWGIRWHWARNESGEYTEIAESPLAGNPDKLDKFHMPDPEEESQYDTFRQMKALYGKEKWIIGSSQISVFEAAWYLRGMEDLMADMVLEPDYVHALMDKVMRFPLVAARKHAEMGADMVWFGDDVAHQQGMMMSVDMWRTFLKPRFAKLFAEPRKVNPAIKICYHSCGNCEAILDDLVEIGLDVLNPVQPMAIDPFKLKKRYGKHLALFGGLCVQHTMPAGSPDEVRAAVRRLKAECGQGGGYILAPAHHLQADTPLDNIAAFYDEGIK